MSTSSPIDDAGQAADRAAVSDPFDHFTGRGRSRAVNRGYSRLVSLLRVTLPVTALVVFAALILWPDVERMMDGAPEPLAPEAAVVAPQADSGNGQMANPRFSGVDADDRPYNISGAAARPGDREGVMEIDEPMADIMMEDGVWLALQARRARYDEASGRIELLGDVNVFRDDGYTVSSDQVFVDTEDRIAWGDAPVLGHGPQGEIVSQGFRIDQAQQVIVFTGDTRLRVRRPPSPEAGF